MAEKLDSVAEDKLPTTTSSSEPISQPQDENVQSSDDSDGQVDWDGPDDPENPKNWPDSKKWLNIGVLSAITIIA